MGTHAVARDAAGGVGCVEEGRGRDRTSASPLSTEVQNASTAPDRRCVPMPSRFGRLDHCCFGVSLGVEGTGSLGFRDNLVKTLLPFSSSRYIATTMVPSLSAPCAFYLFVRSTH